MRQDRDSIKIHLPEVPIPEAQDDVTELWNELSELKSELEKSTKDLAKKKLEFNSVTYMRANQPSKKPSFLFVYVAFVTLAIMLLTWC